MTTTLKNIGACHCLLAVLLAGWAGCARSPEVREAKFLELGKKQLAQKDYARAILQFRNAAQVMPKDAEPYYQLGLAYLAIDDMRLAVGCFRKAAELDPKHTGAQLKLVELFSTSRNKEVVEEAEKRAREVLKSLPDDAEALNLLGQAELRLGKPESAEEHLQNALRKSPGHLKSSVNLAKTRLSRGDVAGAEEALRQGVAEAPNSPEARTYLGEFYLALNRTADAERELRRVLQSSPKYAPALLNLAAMDARAGRMAEAAEGYRRVSQLPEKEYKNAYGLFLFQSGKRAEAVAEFERVAGEDPKDRPARTHLVRAYLAAGRVPDAEAVLTKALNENPKDVDALLQRSKLYLVNANYHAAQTDLNKALTYRSDSAEAQYLLAKAHQGLGERVIQKQRLFEALRLNRSFLPARLELAQMLVAANGAASALKLLDEAPPSQRSHLLLVIQRNWAHLAMGDKEQARRGIEQVLTAASLPEVIMQDAALRLLEKDYAGARASLERILAENPEDLGALDLLVRSHPAQKELPAGVRKARKLVEQRPHSPLLQHYLGRVLLENGDRAAARQAFEAAKANQMGWVAADLSLAELDVMEGKREAARKRLSEVLSSNSDNVAARLMLAGVEESEGQRAAAVEHYRKVLERDRRNLLALNNLAYLLAHENQHIDDAVRYAQQAREIAPESAAVDDTLGWAYFRKGLYTLAVKHLEAATAREGSARRRYHLGMSYWKAGDEWKARESLQAALRMDPAIPEAQEARRLLETGSRQ
jgi:tetratricopeptide (TPR) repeat protein